ncbi:unnamed protein product [Arabidopsis halleri]
MLNFLILCKLIGYNIQTPKRCSRFNNGLHIIKILTLVFCFKIFFLISVKFF